MYIVELIIINDNCRESRNLCHALIVYNRLLSIDRDFNSHSSNYFILGNVVISFVRFVGKRTNLQDLKSSSHHCVFANHCGSPGVPKLQGAGNLN